MRSILSAFYLFATVIFVQSAYVQAAELKITDSLGLVRAMAEIESGAAAEFEIQSDKDVLPPFIRLKNLDGLAPQKELPHSGNGLYQTGDLPPGTWQIITEQDKLVVTAVRITTRAKE